MTNPRSLYSRPTYYDAVFGGWTAQEFFFLLDCYHRFSPQPLRRVYEPAAGTGRLLAEFARCGISTYGCDLDVRSSEYCIRRLSRFASASDIRIADMRFFRPPVKVNLAYSLISSFQHLLSEECAQSFLTSVSESLVPGGVFILGLQLTPDGGRSSEPEDWVGFRGQSKIAVRIDSVRYSEALRIDECEMKSVIHGPRGRSRFREVLKFRTYTAKQILKTTRRIPGLELVGSYDFTYDLNNPVALDQKSKDTLLVFRRRS
jgi:SAM-dependent methyltransferase